MFFANVRSTLPHNTHFNCTAVYVYKVLEIYEVISIILIFSLYCFSKRQIFQGSKHFNNNYVLTGNVEPYFQK